PFDRTIVVPFPWQSALSGIADVSGQSIGWYRRSVRIPDAWRGRRVWLCFGAIEHEARVWVNGQAVGRHEGGNTSLAFDITNDAPWGEDARIDVRVRDARDSEAAADGSSDLVAASGIWQTAWLEARPATHVDALRLTSSQLNDQWVLDAEVELVGDDGSAAVVLRSPDATVSEQRVSVNLIDGRGAARTRLTIADPKAWSPEQPRLYDLEITVDGADGQRDVVRSYFGLRTIARGRLPAQAHEVILLNGEPLYLRGAMDPSLNVEGLSTAPSDEFLQRDLRLARQLGLNLLKTRSRAAEPRRLYWADKLGILLWQEVPTMDCGTEHSREAWQAMLQALIRRDFNHPALIGWTLFHESRGIGGPSFKEDTAMQKWVFEQVEEVKQRLDPTRLVEDNATSLLDHVNTDLNSWQFRIDDYWVAREHIAQFVSRTRQGSPVGYVPGLTQGTAPLACGEFVAVGPEGGDVSWPMRFLLTQLRRHAIIQGHIVGSFHDVPGCRDGLVRFDRSAKEFGYDAFLPGMTLADLQGDDFIGFDSPPSIETTPGEEMTLPLFASHYSGRPGPVRLRWRIVGIDDYGRPVASEPQTREMAWQRGTVTYQTPLRIRVPEGPNFVGALLAELLDAQNRRIAANYVNLIADKAVEADLGGGLDRSLPLRAYVEVLAPRLVALRIPPREFAAFQPALPEPSTSAAAAGHFAFDASEVEYRIALPDFVREAIPSQMVLMAELAATAGAPNGRTELRSGTIQVSIWGHELWEASLPGHLADSRGVLSHHARFRDGAYGELLRRRIDLTPLPQLREDIYQKASFPLLFRATTPETRLSIFGRELGRYVIDPTLIIQTAKQIDRQVGFVSHESVTVDHVLDANPPSPAEVPGPARPIRSVQSARSAQSVQEASVDSVPTSAPAAASAEDGP
ncbi:MAG: glycoside hydrolase family 2 TIM barrel-domain containing protein, partial [Patescibacteria group bacterium]|nr:glycoside hydrolase family 2 TIM barrel-domain containing protein [Patescibacteria group bacterium]